MKKFLWLSGAVLLAALTTGAAAQTQSQTTPTGRIRGTVVDAASGSPISYVTVSVSNAGSPIGAVTDDDGAFSLPLLPVGRYDVRATFLGYEPATMREVVVSSAKETVLEIAMTESVLAIEEVVVRPRTNKEKPLNSMALTGARMLSIEEASRFAGGLDDPARLVTAFAGAAGGGSSNSIAIRGNSPQSLQWKLEGVEIPNPNHFPEASGVGGGVLTAFSSNMLANSDFFTGAFPAQYDNALSGVFDMMLRSGNNQTFEHSAQFGTLGLEFASEGPFQKGKGSYLINYRYSSMSLLGNLIDGLNGIAGVKYQDLSFKINLPTRRAGTFTLWGIGSHDTQDNPVKSQEELEADEYYNYKSNSNQYMGAAGLSHRVFFSTDIYMKTTLAATYAQNHIWGSSYSDETRNMREAIDIKDKNTHLIFNTYVNTKTSARHTNRTGMTLTGLFYDDNFNRAPGNSYLTGPIENYVDTDGSSLAVSVFSQSMFQFNERLSGEIGVNGGYFAFNKKWTVEPRASLRWKAAPRHILAVAGGMHSRREKLDYYFVTTPATGSELVNKNLGPAKALHATLSWDWAITGDLHLRVEPYFQHLYDVPVVPGSNVSIINQDNLLMSNPLVNNGKGRNFGVDLTLERYLKNGLYWMVTGSIFDSQYTGDDGVWHSTTHNRRWLANVLGGKEWMLGRKKQHVLAVSLRVNAMGGQHYTPIDEAASLAAKDPIEDESRMMEARWPAMFTVHANLSWQLHRPKVTHEVGIKMVNLNGAVEHYGFEYNRLHHRMDEATGSWMLPNLYYKISF